MTIVLLVIIYIAFSCSENVLFLVLFAVPLGLEEGSRGSAGGERRKGRNSASYMGMTIGRFVSGLLAARFHSWKIIRMGEYILGTAIVLLLLPIPPFLQGWVYFWWDLAMVRCFRTSII